jgi:branched-chain amino acid transport system ATP-binding protein
LSEFLLVENVSKSFGKVRAVDNVSFDLSENEILGIAGPNGAGKTTLFNLISGIPFHADSGHVFLQGRAIHNTQPHSICQMGLARTFQRETVFETMTVIENVMVGAVFGHETRKHNPNELAMQALELVGLVDRSNELARHLPLFDKKRLMLASALVTQPILLLLDEPAAGLNRLEIQQTMDLIRKLNARNITIILIEHVLPLLLELSQRIIILNQGQKLAEGTPANMVSNEQVIEAYLGRRKNNGSSVA